jgi:leucine dehydrogenase
VKNIYEQMGRIFTIAKEQQITTMEAANHLAEERISQMLNIRSTFLSSEKSSISKR